MKVETEFGTANLAITIGKVKKLTRKNVALKRKKKPLNGNKSKKERNWFKWWTLGALKGQVEGFWKEKVFS